MDDREPCKTVLDKIFDCVNSGFNWTTLQIKSACPHKRKKSAEEDGESGKIRDDRDEIPSDDPRSSETPGTDPRSSEIPGTVPKSPYGSPDLCPSVKPRCFIRMQDPCAPCCCDTKPKPLPCPPKYGPREQREPICGCDLCQRNPNHEKCCDKSKTLRGITIDRRYFEKA